MYVYLGNPLNQQQPTGPITEDPDVGRRLALASKLGK
jgi:hypothetical protein